MTTTPEPGPTAPFPAQPQPLLPQPPQAEAVDGPPQEQPGRVRRRWSRGRLALLIGGAAVLGVLGGGGIGYDIQAGRPPTPLPPLAGDRLHYPLAHATASPAPLPANQDDAVRTDGDLTALLVPAPSGSKPWEQPDTPDGWLSPAGFAVGYKKPDSEFRWLLENGFRRAAEAEWIQGDTSYQVVLTQFQKQHEANAATELTAQQGYAKSFCGGDQVTVPGTAAGVVYAGTNSHTDSGGNSYYQGRGFVQHGDILVEVYATGPGQISASSVMSVLQSQLERL
ncbi:hypothetical protein [Streptacidiphilus jiangxiensis]|uniref:PknH-like extracellular domain-containing protein n=1 Tax=Streptacidiphilus jiangxiensis TaxID=235985 RepID=A0A1H7J5J4_STRJI|nr:hypothetical protein [Streptacidiphilus jiangxiensis]SEK69664.1 hypothetical protein SAMN05414137_103146 [Streptacidiphilus jiangxiensis]